MTLFSPTICDQYQYFLFFKEKKNKYILLFLYKLRCNTFFLGLEEDCKKNKEQLKSPISKVHEQAQKRQLSVEFELIKESGPSHKRSFLTECRLGDIISTGEGFSKKESKR